MLQKINGLQAVERLGEVQQYLGLKLIANGPPLSFIGEVCEILNENHHPVMKAEVIGFAEGKVHLMPYHPIPVRMGYTIRGTGYPLTINVHSNLLGKSVDAFARPLNPSIPNTSKHYLNTHNQAINPFTRASIKERLHTGIHAIDALLPFGKGQRIGIFAGSGVGKSSLIAQIAQHIESDINIIALIGERGREVKEFITQHLDENTLKKSILVVACSDESALMRRQAAYTATTLAEYFCQKGQQVMLFMDSITRFAMAQREIGLSLGEPPTARGYTPSVFASLPGLVERAGAFNEQGSISAIYTVLVEGDDFNEPLADHMRALLDGHVVLSRELAQKSHYPAISVLQSISRLSQQLLGKEEQQTVKEIISTLSLYQQNKELIELGAYKAETNLALDLAIKRMPFINALLTQEKYGSLSFEDLMYRFKEILQ